MSSNCVIDRLLSHVHVESNMNMSKTTVMVNQCCATGTVNLLGATLRQVDSYVYLGRELDVMSGPPLPKYFAGSGSMGSFQFDSRSDQPHKRL